MRLIRLAAAFAVALLPALLAACTSDPGRRTTLPREGEVSIVELGDHYDSPAGKVFVVRIQDEYRVIRCIPEGPIAGCYEDVLSVPRSGLSYNRWIPVDNCPGLEVAFLSPREVAFRTELGAPQPR